MNVKRARWLTLGAALLFASIGLGQDEGAAIRIDVSECVDLAADSERYQCYERLVSAVRPARAAETETDKLPASGGNLPGPEAGAPTRTLEATTANATELTSTIATLEERRPNEYVIALANGQVWQQTTAKRYALRVGDEVRVYSTSWGRSYRLTAPRLRSYIQVELLR